uniref:Uncharacterized protein n=1 Tax=Pyramimonas obovata TaxID=1411642 RepID=A0A7S0WIT2_9CHLO|eukprot:CAMPEP_0118930598 /NCGR_PEP_ID=MMETSP1169-20130426/7228_1 /TAXON_ID=36882 /ORGANISM="Pyramimonas obovata, Strain CCMP722" /LENGTH=240 /DNA_ID=CAMNT_0006872977 /DNA_START=90 /DNA_END=812 /DNA_ORIENTATION=+
MTTCSTSTVAHIAVHRARSTTASKARAAARSVNVRSRAFLGNTMGLTPFGYSCSASSSKFVVRAANTFADEVVMTGEEYVVVGLAHCFEKIENKLVPRFVVEPVTAGTVHSMAAGALTSYKALTSLTLGEAIKMDLSALPDAIRSEDGVQFADNFVFRTECAARTWSRPHAVEHCQDIVPSCPDVRSDWNYSVTNNTRILNFENIVNDDDNVKQDMSIDVYGRKEEGTDIDQQIEDLANA